MTKKEARQNQFIELYKKKIFNVTAACKALGISRIAYYKWLKEKKFAQKIQDAREELIDFAENKLIQQINSGNMTAIIFFLKCQAKDRGYTETILHGSDEDKPLKIKVTVDNGTD